MDKNQLTFEDALQIAHKCKEYSGPKEYNGGEHYEAFQHGIETVINVLNFVKFSGIKPSQLPTFYVIGGGETPAEETPSKPTVLNVNSTVRVKLTKHGRSVNTRDLYMSPKEDAEGRSEWKLWQLMQIFGPHMSLGGRPCFEADIEVVE